MDRFNCFLCGELIELADMTFRVSHLARNPHYKTGSFFEDEIDELDWIFPHWRAKVITKKCIKPEDGPGMNSYCVNSPEMRAMELLGYGRSEILVTLDWSELNRRYGDGAV